MISLLVVSLDFKLSECFNPVTEHSSLRSHETNAVIRLFGSTDRGLRICAHIHGFVPYVYFRPEEMHDVVFESEESLTSYLSRMEKTLEELLRKRYESSTSSSNRTNFKRIKKLEIVRRKTIYGFYSESFLFVKVFLRDPNDISKLATVLDEGGLCGICMQAYEGHIPYLLKFTCDLNIAPMGWITLKDVQYRSKSGPPVSNSTSLDKESSCELEVDAHFRDIEIVESQGFGSELWEEERIRCERKFLEPDRQPTPPSTLTNHRTKTSSECNYIQRLRNLMEKGQTLMRVNQHIQAAAANPSSTPTNPSPVMSQIGQTIASSPIGALKSRSISFQRDSIDANDSSRLFSSPSPSVLGAGLGVGMLSPDILRLTPDSNVYRWVVSTIKKSEEQVVQSGQLFERLLTEDPANVAEEFLIRSQISEDQEKEFALHCKAATNTAAGQKLVECEAVPDAAVAYQNGVSIYDLGANADDDEIHTAEVIQAEVENILQSTQPADAVASNLIKASNQNYLRSVAQKSSSSSSGHYVTSNDPLIESGISYHDAQDHRDSKASSSISKPPLPRIHTYVNSAKTPNRKHDLSSRDEISSFSPGSHASSLQPSFTATSFLNDSLNTLSSSPYLRLEKKSNLTLGSVFNPNRKRTLSSSISSAAIGSPADSDSLNPNSIFFPGESPPIGIAQVNDEVRSAFKSSNKKLNRTVSFLEPTPGSSAISQQSYIPRASGSYDSSSADENYLVENFSFISDSPIAVSSVSSAKRYDAMILQPTFDAPAVSQLTPIHVYGLPDLVNPPIVWSNRADLIQAKDVSTAFHRIISRHAVKFKFDAEAFDGGFPDLSDDEKERGNGINPKTPPFPVARVRCLVPLFSPPPPSVLWQSLCTDGSNGDQSNDLIRDKKFSPASPNVSNTQKYAKSQINSPTQTQVRVMKRKGGNAIQREDLIGKGNLTARKSRTSVMSVEIICEVRQGYLPNPKFDPVKCICWVINDKVSDSESESTQKYQGMICVDLQAIQTDGASNASMIMMQYKSCGLPPLFDIQIVPTEAQLFELFVSIVGEADPDFFIGYDINRNSVGYLVKRGKLLSINLLQLLSKVPNEPPNFRNNTGEEEDSMYGQGEPSILITGRILLNLWNYMRSELKLMSYTYASVAEHVLAISVPYYTTSQLSRWFHSTVSRHRALRHLCNLTELNLMLIERVDMVRKTAECARLYGIDFTSVLTRGSQYRVEASLLKKAHAFEYLLITPSRKRVAAQAPMEVIPLVMEPQSGFYKDPVVVLDFQSLYPSMIIAYNLCYSTCIGKMVPIERRSVENFDGEEVETETTGRLGVVRYPEAQSALSSIMHQSSPNLNGPGDYGSNGLSIQVLAESENAPYVSPNGSAFCSKSVRLGILPMMCKEMLETRIMLKRAMKRHKDESSGVLSKVLDARQLAVKLLSNVTYGYTAAGFSGRMPMAELADAVVQSGRSTLEWTIQYIQNNPDWRARVVYGDTDSVFVELQGRSKEEAFRIGNEIAQEITSKSPADVLLKFEKVYFPCVLVTKKRYVGCSFETLTQPPHLDAKGIEMVRRDQCPAAMKMQEKALRLLFETRDASCVKKYLLSQWEKMVQGGDRLLLRDFIFRKEVRFGHYANISSQPPGAIVATKQVLLDDMAVPPYNWRVPYVVVHGVPNAPLKNLVFSPEDVLRRGSPLRVNYNYYIHKCINPALDRVLSLCGLDVSSWFRGMARPRQRLRHFNYDTLGSADERIAAIGNGTNNMLARKKQTTMDQFTTRGSCEICGERDALPQRSLCGHCSDNRMGSLITLTERLKTLEIKSQELSEICRDCAQCSQPADLFVRGQMVGCESCESLDCVVFHERCRLVTRMEDAKMSVAEIEDLGR